MSRKSRTDSLRQQRRSANELRIIAGSWRGRRLTFPDLPGLRPTPDRVRETLFNWLQTAIPGARCLDLFAGSGALGLEALSRGAGDLVLVERAQAAADALREHCRALGADRVTVVTSDALHWLATNPAPFDIVFLDPPFDSELLTQVVALMEDKNLLKAGGLIYFETSRDLDPAQLPDSWEPIRHKQAGQVHYGLLARKSEPD